MSDMSLEELMRVRTTVPSLAINPTHDGESRPPAPVAALIRRIERIEDDLVYVKRELRELTRDNR